jgi:thiamine kinase-like enzyme
MQLKRQNCLRSDAVLDAGASLVSIKTHSLIEEEPDKNSSIAKLLIAYKNGENQDKELAVFVKFQTSRGTPTWVKAFGSAFSSYHNEQQFYESELHKSSGLKTPKFIAGWFSRTFHRVLTVLELIPSKSLMTVADHKGASIFQATDLLASVGKMHAKYWKKTDRSYCIDNHTSHLVPRKGVEWIDIITLLSSSHSQSWFAPIWLAIVKKFENYDKMTLCHGDCRPGNMLFERGSEKAFGHIVTFADWEAVNFTPYLWDFTYMESIGVTIETRRKYHDQLLSSYLQVLISNGVDAKCFDAQSVKDDISLMTIILCYYSWMLMQTKMVGKEQGNTPSDVNNWKERIHTAALDYTADVQRIANLLQVPASLIESFRNYEKTQLPEYKEINPSTSNVEVDKSIQHANKSDLSQSPKSSTKKTKKSDGEKSSNKGRSSRTSKKDQ